MVSARQLKTEQRRREILDAALDTLVSSGDSRGFVEEVCRRSSASVGTVYHHFGSKDTLIATLHYTILNDYQRGAGAILDSDPPAEEGIKETVDHHLRWLVRHPRPAAFLLQHPFAGYRSVEVAAELTEENTQFLAVVRSWLDRRMESGEVRRMPFDLVVALLIGPVHHWARGALFGGSPSAGSIRLASAEIAEGAWQALRPADPRSARPSGRHRTK